MFSIILSTYRLLHNVKIHLYQRKNVNLKL